MLENGKVAGRGSHAALMRTSETYRSMWQT